MINKLTWQLKLVECFFKLATNMKQNIHFQICTHHITQLHWGLIVPWYLFLLDQCQREMYCPELWPRPLRNFIAVRHVCSCIWSRHEICPNWTLLTEVSSVVARWTRAAGLAWLECEPASIWRLSPALYLRYCDELGVAAYLFIISLFSCDTFIVSDMNAFLSVSCS